MLCFYVLYMVLAEISNDPYIKKKKKNGWATQTIYRKDYRLNLNALNYDVELRRGIITQNLAAIKEKAREICLLSTQ